MGILNTLGLTNDSSFGTVPIDGFQKQKNSGEKMYAALGSQLSDDRDKFSHLTAPTVNAATGQVAQLGTGQADATRANQNALIGQLQAQANGTGPSLASGILKEGTDRTLAGQMAAAASLGGSNPALAQRQLALGAVGANQQLAHDTAQVRIQEQLNAQNQLGSVLGNIRGQDLGQAQSQAELQQQINLANLQNQQQVNLANQNATLGVQQNNASNDLAFGNALGSTINSAVAGQQYNTNTDIGQNQWAQEQQAKQDAANAAFMQKLVGGAANGAAGALTGGII